MKRFDCKATFARNVHAVPGSCWWVDYHYRQPVVADPGDRTFEPVEPKPTDFYRGATPLSVAAFATLAGLVAAVGSIL